MRSSGVASSISSRRLQATNSPTSPRRDGFGVKLSDFGSSFSRRLRKNPSAVTNSASTRCATKVAKAVLMSPSLLTLRTWRPSPSTFAAACRSLIWGSANGDIGFASTPIIIALGTSSYSNSSCFEAS
jgi:hypothetical protein